MQSGYWKEEEIKDKIGNKYTSGVLSIRKVVMYAYEKR
jgi:hypothetical protein